MEEGGQADFTWRACLVKNNTIIITQEHQPPPPKVKKHYSVAIWGICSQQWYLQGGYILIFSQISC